jgi:hypothetical protein
MSEQKLEVQSIGSVGLVRMEISPDLYIAPLAMEGTTPVIITEMAVGSKIEGLDSSVGEERTNSASLDLSFVCPLFSATAMVPFSRRQKRAKAHICTRLVGSRHPLTLILSSCSNAHLPVASEDVVYCFVDCPSRPLLDYASMMMSYVLLLVNPWSDILTYADLADTRHPSTWRRSPDPDDDVDFLAEGVVGISK